MKKEKFGKSATHSGQRYGAERNYRQLVRSHLSSVRVTVQETDLSIHAAKPVAHAARENVIGQRGRLENYIRQYPDFLRTLEPWPDDPMAPGIVQDMIRAARSTGVGPMAAVAGAMAARVGKALLEQSSEVIIENGGDIFLQIKREICVAVYAGASPLSLKLGIQLKALPGPRAVCTSSGTVGHSLSFGKADAVCILGTDCALADAAATAVGNRIQKPEDIQTAITWGRTIQGIQGILVILGRKMGAWGELEIKPLEKKGLSFKG